MFKIDSAQLLVMKVQGDGNRGISKDQLMNKPILLILFHILNCKTGSNDDALDHNDNPNEGGLFTYYQAITDRVLKDTFLQCKQKMIGH
eukprot:3536016-Ditylum_brightwellii.AAC.1